MHASRHCSVWPVGGTREGVFPRFSWAINPNVPVSLFDPDEPLRADLNIAAGVTAEVLPGLSFTGVAQKRIVGMLDDITRESDSQLPRVRSDFAEFLREGDPGITRLTADYVTKLAPSVYGRLSGGLLESMFGGVSGEVLWQPVAQPWGVGIEINYARQRDFDMRFSSMPDAIWPRTGAAPSRSPAAFRMAGRSAPSPPSPMSPSTNSAKAPSTRG